MGGEAPSVGVLGIDASHARGIERLDVEEREGLRPVKTAQHDVRTVREAGAGAGHPLLQGAASVRALSVDILRAEESVEAHCPRVHRRIVARARQAHAMATRGAEVAVKRTDPARGGVSDVRGAHGADGDVTLTADRR